MSAVSSTSSVGVPTRFRWLVGAVAVLCCAFGIKKYLDFIFPPPSRSIAAYSPRRDIDTGGLGPTTATVGSWDGKESLEVIANRWKNASSLRISKADAALNSGALAEADSAKVLMMKAMSLNYVGKPAEAYAALEDARKRMETDPESASANLYTLIYYQGVTALRLGETENCLNCRGVSACIIPFNPAAVHQIPRGSRLAIQHFTEYLSKFPDDMEVRWLLNIAHMTLGQYPGRVDPRYRISLDHFQHSEFDIGKFLDVSSKVGLERTNQAGGAIMDDFNNDGLLDVMVTSYDTSQPMGYFQNMGNGKFQEKTQEAGLLKQLGGLNCMQTDYDNDGHLDVFVVRGAWLSSPIRPSLLRNNGNGTLTDVTEKAGLATALNSNAALWTDYDNDGCLDVFVCCEKQANRLYHNQGDGTFRDVAKEAGLLGTVDGYCKGAAWIDYDRDGAADLFVNYLDGSAHLFRNDRNGRFTDVSRAMGIDGPKEGFSCWVE